LGEKSSDNDLEARTRRPPVLASPSLEERPVVALQFGVDHIFSFCVQASSL
jgi:hypothetical protein